MSQTTRIKSGAQGITRAVPDDSFLLVNPDCQFGPKNLRSNLIPRASFNPYVEGNFRFVYKNCQQLTPKQRSELSDTLYLHSFFPESPPNLNLVFCVETDCTDDFVCPICFFTPVAPRMTHCGHICCHDCLKQLFRCAPKHQCPFCSEPILPDELIRAHINYIPDPKVLHFKKVHRNRICTICSPCQIVPTALPQASNPLSCLSRFTIADPVYIRSVLSEEVSSLQTQIAIYSEYSDAPEKMAALQETLSEVKAENDHISDDHTVFPITFIPKPSQNPSSNTNTSSSTNSNPNSNPNSNANSKPVEVNVKADYITFYTEAKGRLVLMDKVNFQMLLTEFGSIENAPNEFSAPILSSTEITVDSHNHNERPEFWHLPNGAEVRIAFLDLSHVVSAKTLAQYKLSIRLHTSKPKRKQVDTGPVISEADFQRFEPLEDEPEAILNSVQEFPQLNTQKEQKISEKKEKAEEFPALGFEPPKSKTKAKPKPKMAWGNIHM